MARPRGPAPCKWIVYRPDSRIWVGMCVNFVHANATRRKMPEPEKWLLGCEYEHQLKIKGRGGWVHLAEPGPWKIARCYG